MRKKLSNILIFSTIIQILFAISLFSADNKNKVRVVVIDAGHGGEDPGAVGKECKEKDLTLSVALKLGKYLEENFPDIKVIYTRDKDVFIPLHQRAEIANQNNADLFISIHVNANNNSGIQGSETYAMGLHKTESNLDVAKRENAVILIEKDYSQKYEGFDPTSAESYIIFNLLQNTHLSLSLDFASSVQTQFREKAKRVDRGVKQAGFLVLWKTSMPSVLIEIGYISNKNEERYLATDLGQDYIASSIFRAFREYKNNIENKSNFSQSNVVTPIVNYQKAPEFPKSIVIQDTTKLVIIDTNSNINKDEIYFRVQLLSSATKVESIAVAFKDLQNVQELYINETYKYTLGNSQDYNKIVLLKNEMKQFYPDAFIIAIQNGKIIPVNEAVKDLNKK